MMMGSENKVDVCSEREGEKNRVKQLVTWRCEEEEGVERERSNGQWCTRNQREREREKRVSWVFSLQVRVRSVTQGHYRHFVI
jgi:hypothetical protein